MFEHLVGAAGQVMTAPPAMSRATPVIHAAASEARKAAAAATAAGGARPLWGGGAGPPGPRGAGDIHWAQAVLDLAAHRLDVAEAGDVPGDAGGIAAVAADPGHHAGHSAGVSAVDGDRGAAAGELGGDGRADAPGAAGDQGGTAVQ